MLQNSVAYRNGLSVVLGIGVYSVWESVPFEICHDTFRRNHHRIKSKADARAGEWHPYRCEHQGQKGIFDFVVRHMICTSLDKEC